MGLAVVGALVLGAWALTGSESAPQQPAQADASRQFAQLPLRFEVNRGQAAGSVHFLARGPGYTMALARDGAVLSLTNGKAARAAGGATSAVVGMHLIGGNANPTVSGIDRQAGVSNYMVGADRSKWHTNVPSYARVRYESVYPGIDMVYRGNQKELEYDFIVAPGANPAKIELGFRGSRKLSITPTGDLLIHSRSGAIRQRRPILFQGSGASKTSVSGRYVLRDGGRQVGFQIGAYDATKTLVVDPSIAYSTFLGGHNMSVANGSAQDTTNGIAVDAAGNTYVVGFTDSIPPPPVGSSPYPTTTGALQTSFQGGPRDGFVTKLNPAGNAVLYSTYLGGSAEDRATDVAVDSAGNAYVSGFTISTQFPTTPGAADTTFGGGAATGATPTQPRDAFIAKLNATGSALLYSTYLGGTGADTANRIEIDSSGAAYVGGNTAPGTGTAAVPSVTNDFPTTTGAYDTTFGGGAGPTAPNDAFVTKINPAGSALVYSTYLGGNQPDTGTSIAVDSSGSAYVTGATRTTTGLTTAGAFQTTHQSVAATDSDAYVAKLNPTGDALTYATYIGGGRFEGGNGIAVDSGGNALITGETNSTNFPTTAGSNQPNQASAPGPNDSDSFVTKLNPTGSALVWSTYNGSNTYDTGTDIAVDPGGNAYAVGNTLGGFPLKNPVQVRTGDYDSYLTKFSSTGGLIYSTIYGGGSRDFGQAVTADAAGNAYIGGRTDYYGPDAFPIKNAAQPLNAGFADAWVAKISPTPTSVLIDSLRGRGGPVSGGTTVVIHGEGFTGATAVNFGATPATSFNVDSPTQITAVSPPHAAGKVNVTVTTPAGTSPDNPVTLFEYAEGVWRLTAPLGVVHYDQQMRLLDNGKVLIIGGHNAMFGATIATSELYDPGARTWSTTGSLNTPRSSYSATRLDGPACRTAAPAAHCGRILVAGGSPNSASSNTALNTAEIYDPSTGTWTNTTGNMVVSRVQHAATLLDGPACHTAGPPAYCGKVLVTGGLGATPPSTTNAPLSSAELYDPATGTWSATGAMFHTARQTASVQLPNDKVLLAGGDGNNRAVTEIYDPATGNWSTAGALNIGRERHSVVLLANGKVLVAAGTRPGDPAYLGTPQQAGDSAELFDPSTETWTLLPDRLKGVARNNHDTALLPSGKVLLAGGGRGGLTSELFDPATNTWSSAGQLNLSRGSGHPQASTWETVVLSSNPRSFAADASVCGNDCGKVLVAGNNDNRSAELYTPEPRVTAITPAGGPAAGGTSVKITGQGFTHNVRSVLFGTTPAASFTADSYGQITAIAPAGSGSSKITVVNEGGTATSADDFVYAAAETPAGAASPGAAPPPPPSLLPGPGPGLATPLDRTAPTGRLLFTKRTIRRRELSTRRGLGVGVQISEAGTIEVRIYLDNGARLPALRASGARPRLTLLAKGTARRSSAGRAIVRVKLTAAGRARLRKFRRTRVVLSVTLRDLAGNPRRLPSRRAVITR